LGRVKTFALGVLTIIQDETMSWIQEFQATLKSLDEAAKVGASAAEPGALNIVVENGDQCAKGWTLIVDNSSPVAKSGKTAALAGLIPGLHVVKAQGEIGAAMKRAEAPVRIEPGATATLPLTLS
jgi:hypothetical protein